MKKIFLILSFVAFLNAQEYSLEQLKQQSQENLKKSSLAEVSGLDPIKNKRAFNWILESNKEYPNSRLFLNHLKSISSKQAQILSRFQGLEIYLNGLTKINESIVRALLPFEGILYLDGLAQIDQDSLRALEFSSERRSFFW